jgi:glycosyltransferase involved in cell wall biosynthesis
VSHLDLSLVIPLFNEEESLAELHAWIDRVCLAHGLRYEVLFINDGSTDGSWQVIEGLAAQYPQVRGIRFRRNQGKSAALHVGFQAAQGDVVITMDADLQDSPDEIPDLVRMIREEGYDLVSGWKKKRYDPLSKTLPTKLFNWAARKMSGIYLHDFNCGLKAYRLEVAQAVEVQGEMHRYVPVLAKMQGFTRIGEKVVEHRARPYGVTKFGLNRFTNGLLDLVTLSMVSRFRRRPMHFFGTWGLVMFFFSGLSLTVLGGLKLARLWSGQRPGLIADDPWFYIFLTAMILGTQLFVTGLLAELVVRSGRRRTEYGVTEELNRPDADRPAR